MGDAKRRGTKEERTALAIKRDGFIKVENREVKFKSFGLDQSSLNMALMGTMLMMTGRRRRIK